MPPTKFDLPLHDLFVQEHSEPVAIFKSHKCPCGAEPDAGRSNVNCLACEGTGLLYDAPANINAMVVGIQSQRSWIMEGLADHGDLVLSISPFESFMVRDWDKVKIAGWNDGELYQGEVVRRGQTSVDRLHYSAVQVNRVFDVNPATGAIVVYVAPTSFSVSGNIITWVSGQPQPVIGRNYTIEYNPVFEWLAFLPTVQRREQTENLGQRVLLRKKHVGAKKKAPA